MSFPDFDVAAFLREYWQKKPLLIRNPWVTWRNPITPDELAGLACDEGVESRLITKRHEDLTLEHGPVPEARFSELGTEPWTLLVQAVDHHVPDVAALIDPFRFVPNWRVDDVMVSYATDGGGVGAHFDRYDVFLVQGLGKRRWQIGAICDDDTELHAHDDLRLLAQFAPTDEWILEPGDILYVPPLIAHHGVAVSDDCMTYSIGFRAPAQSELIAHWCEHVLDETAESELYRDPDLALQPNPGEISAKAISQLYDMVTAKLLDRNGFARWFGEHVSTPKPSDIDWRPDQPIEIEALRNWLAEGVPLSRNPASRFSFIRHDGERHDGERITVFVDGQSFDCADDTMILAEQICASDRIDGITSLLTSPDAEGLLLELLNNGSLAFDHDEMPESL
jgi:50S ribosomal protein L16 3-hydroxylase